jgi:hypothetical protein
LESWNVEELAGPYGITADEPARRAADLFSRTDEEINEDILHDGAEAFEPWSCTGSDWRAYVKQELGTRVNSVEELEGLWGRAPLYAEWPDCTDSLLQENGYTLEEAIGYMEDGIRIYCDELVLEQEEDVER